MCLVLALMVPILPLKLKQKASLRIVLNHVNFLLDVWWNFFTLLAFVCFLTFVLIPMTICMKTSSDSKKGMQRMKPFFMHLPCLLCCPC